jgi:hypothetical protein
MTNDAQYAIPAVSGFAILGADLFPGSKQPPSEPKVAAKPPPAASKKHYPPLKIKSHMIYALFATTCFFFPIGLAAVFASKNCIMAVKDVDYKLAQRLSKQAKQLANVAILIGIVILMIFSSTLLLYLMNVQNIKLPFIG